VGGVEFHAVSKLMKQALKAVSPLSPYRAFVVQFQAKTNVARGRFAGRVEHIVSGQMTHFSSLEELLAFLGSVLIQVRRPSRQQPREGERRHV
jgi:hypothetical protein